LRRFTFMCLFTLVSTLWSKYLYIDCSFQPN
jgi:hypothetical protein